MLKRFVTMLCSLSVALVLLAMPVFAAGSAIQKDFTKDNIDDWSVAPKDSWVIEKGYLNQKAYDWNAASFGDEKNDDFTYETSVKSLDFKSDDWAAQVYFRFRVAKADSFNGYAFVINNSLLKFVKATNNTEEILKSKEFKPVANKEYSVKIVAVGKTFDVYFDGDKLFSLEDDTYKAGHFEICAWNCKFELGNLKITPAGQVDTTANTDTAAPEDKGAAEEKTTNTQADTQKNDNPKTGDYGMAIYALLAGASAFVASKRIKK